MDNRCNEAECSAAGVPVEVVERLRKRQERLLRDMHAAGVSLFCGSSSSLRPVHGDTKLILATITEGVVDGGCGAAWVRSDGLLRGEE